MPSSTSTNELEKKLITGTPIRLQITELVNQARYSFLTTSRPVKLVPSSSKHDTESIKPSWLKWYQSSPSYRSKAPFHQPNIRNQTQNTRQRHEIGLVKLHHIEADEPLRVWNHHPRAQSHQQTQWISSTQITTPLATNNRVISIWSKKNNILVHLHLRVRIHKLLSRCPGKNKREEEIKRRRGRNDAVTVPCNSEPTNLKLEAFCVWSSNDAQQDYPQAHSMCLKSRPSINFRHVNLPWENNLKLVLLTTTGPNCLFHKQGWVLLSQSRPKAQKNEK